jgi:hypothetical protein
MIMPIFIVLSRQQDELYIRATMSKVSEQQAKAMAIFLLDDLDHYRGTESQRLKQLQRYFPFPLQILSLEKSALEADQRARIKRKEVVLALKRVGQLATLRCVLLRPCLHLIRSW